MPDYFDGTLREMEQLFHSCIYILETEASDQNGKAMQEQLVSLQTQSDVYKTFLSDQAEHSRSVMSRDMASLIIAEEGKIESLLAEYFPDDPEKATAVLSDADYNIRALFEEYLTGRAMQSVREALIVALKLRMLSERSKHITQ